MQFGIGTSEFVAFKNAVEGNGFSTERTNYYEGLSDTQRQEVEIILNEITNYSAINELNSFLENKFDDYANSSLSIEDKNFLLTEVTQDSTPPFAISTNGRNLPRRVGKKKGQAGTYLHRQKSKMNLPKG